jgi:serine kinase of HPr protein (carbohydrate metabolism regulator)
MLGHHLEVRGVGIINIAQMFGIRAIREKKQIQMVMELELWNPEKDYERLGTHVQTMDILGVGLPYMRIPVKPGTEYGHPHRNRGDERKIEKTRVLFCSGIQPERHQVA